SLATLGMTRPQCSLPRRQEADRRFGAALSAGERTEDVADRAPSGEEFRVRGEALPVQGIQERDDFAALAREFGEVGARGDVVTSAGVEFERRALELTDRLREVGEERAAEPGGDEQLLEAGRLAEH